MLLYLLVHWVIYALAILISAHLLPGIVLNGFGASLVAALVLGLLNAVVRPLLLLATLPLTILTLGLFIFVINTLLIMLTSALVPGFEVRSFGSALLFGIILAVINFILNRIVG
jgi:putative membrane protein